MGWSLLDRTSFNLFIAKTADGYESHYQVLLNPCVHKKIYTYMYIHHIKQVNHLGHFLLTLELLPVMVETAGASGDVRIVFVSSAMHARGVFDPANMNPADTTGYSMMQAYSNSKLYNVKWVGFSL